jgi:hypothetical protein
MDAVDEIGIAVSSEGVGNDLSVGVLDLAASAESAPRGGISYESIHVIALEVGADQHLSLDVGWCLLNIGCSEDWILIVEELNVVPGEFVVFGDGCIDVDWIPEHALVCGFVSDVGLGEGCGGKSVLVFKCGRGNTSR